ncbi:hypothetical protein OZ695_004253, partial [Yersinia enterocolitica]
AICLGRWQRFFSLSKWIHKKSKKCALYDTTASATLSFPDVRPSNKVFDMTDENLKISVVPVQEEDYSK